MASVNPEQEFQRLAKLYSSRRDDELLRIAEDRSTLTDIAQRALDDEMRRRKSRVGRWADCFQRDSRVSSNGNDC